MAGFCVFWVIVCYFDAALINPAVDSCTQTTPKSCKLTSLRTTLASLTSSVLSSLSPSNIPSEPAGRAERGVIKAELEAEERKLAEAEREGRSLGYVKDRMVRDVIWQRGRIQLVGSDGWSLQEEVKMIDGFVRKMKDTGVQKRQEGRGVIIFFLVENLKNLKEGTNLPKSVFYKLQSSKTFNKCIHAKMVELAVEK